MLVIPPPSRTDIDQYVLTKNDEMFSKYAVDAADANSESDRSGGSC